MTPPAPSALVSLPELVASVPALLADGYEGVRNGRVRDLPDVRTIRWYQSIGLVDRPATFRGRSALYGRRHLLQIAAIKKLQAAGLSLEEIQAGLPGRTDAELARTLGTRLDEVDALLAGTAAKRAEAVAARTLSAFASRADSASAPPRRRGAFWKVRQAAAAEPLALAPSPAALPLVAAPRSQAVGGSVVVLWNGRQLAPDEVAMLEALAAPLVAYLSSPPSPPAERAGAAPSRRPKPSKESRR